MPSLSRFLLLGFVAAAPAASAQTRTAPPLPASPDTLASGLLLPAPARVWQVSGGGVRYGRLNAVSTDSVRLDGRSLPPALAWAEVQRLEVQAGTRPSTVARVVGVAGLGSLGLVAGTGLGVLAALGGQGGEGTEVLVYGVGGLVAGAAMGYALGSTVRTPAWTPVTAPR